MIDDPTAREATLVALRRHPPPDLVSGEIGQNGALAAPAPALFQAGARADKDRALAAVAEALRAAPAADGGEGG